MLYSIFAQNVYAKDEVKTDIKLLIFGDSITAGYGLANGEDFPAILEQKLKEEGHKVKVINAGISGDTTTGGRNRLDWTLEQNKPDIVVLALGGNDMLRGVSPSVTRDNVDVMLKTLQDKKIKTLLTEVSAPLNFGIAYGKDFNKIYPELAKKYKVETYPFLLKEVYGKSKYMQADGIHPNAEGAKKIAEDLAEFLDDEILD
jgi:acyl-CoA thioesterase-1